MGPLRPSPFTAPALATLSLNPFSVPWGNRVAGAGGREGKRERGRAVKGRLKGMVNLLLLEVFGRSGRRAYLYYTARVPTAGSFPSFSLVFIAEFAIFFLVAGKNRSQYLIFKRYCFLITLYAGYVYGVLRQTRTRSSPSWLSCFLVLEHKILHSLLRAYTGRVYVALGLILLVNLVPLRSTCLVLDAPCIVALPSSLDLLCLCYSVLFYVYIVHSLFTPLHSYYCWR